MKHLNINTLRDFAQDFVAAEPQRIKADGWWQPPLLVSAPVDARFGRLAQIAAEDHLHPTDLLADAHTVIVFFIPFVKKLVKENKAGKECGKCIQACPVDALAEDGFGRRDCWDRLNENRRELFYFTNLPQSTHVCGKCAALMPCSFNNPVKVNR